MISPGSGFRIFLASQPIDFRKGMDGLAAPVANSFALDPFSGAISVFRSRRADRLNGRRFTWPKPQSGPVTLSKVQFDALFEGIDWTKVASERVRKPNFL